MFSLASSSMADIKKPGVPSPVLSTKQADVMVKRQGLNSLATFGESLRKVVVGASHSSVQGGRSFDLCGDQQSNAGCCSRSYLPALQWPLSSLKVGTEQGLIKESGHLLC